MLPEPRILHRKRRGPQRLAEQPDGLGGAGAEDDVLRVGQYTAGASQVVRYGSAGYGQTLRFDIAERFGFEARQPVAQRPQPRMPRKTGQVRRSGKEVDVEAGRFSCAA